MLLPSSDTLLFSLKINKVRTKGAPTKILSSTLAMFAGPRFGFLFQFLEVRGYVTHAPVLTIPEWGRHDAAFNRHPRRKVPIVF